MVGLKVYIEVVLVVCLLCCEVLDLFWVWEWILFLDDLVVLRVFEMEGVCVDNVGDVVCGVKLGIGVVGVEGMVIDCLGNVVKVFCSGVGLDFWGEGFLDDGFGFGI